MFKGKDNNETSYDNSYETLNGQSYNNYLNQQNSEINVNELETNLNIFQDSIKDIKSLNISQKISQYAQQQNLYSEDQNNNTSSDLSNNVEYPSVSEYNYNNSEVNNEVYDNSQFNNQPYNKNENLYANYSNQNHNNYMEQDNRVNTNNTYRPSQEEMGKCEQCSTCIHRDNCEIYINIKTKEEEMARFEEQLRLEREKIKALEELQNQQELNQDENLEYYNNENFNIDSAVQNKIEENQYANIYMEQNNIPSFNSSNMEVQEDDYEHYQFRDLINNDTSLVGLAEPKERFGAFMIDSLILLVLYGLTYLMMFHDSFMHMLDMIMMNNSNLYTFNMLSPFITRFISFLCVLIIIKFIYYVFIPLYLFKGKTIGKKIKNIQVMSAHQDVLDIDFNILFKREIIGKFIGFIFFGYLKMYKREDKKCYHDIYADTKVVRD